MSVPSCQSMMSPLLKSLGDGGDRRWAGVKDALATATGVSETDRAELLPSGRQATFDNRAGWAATYLSQAGLVDQGNPAHN
jgi:restriction system protein